MYQFLIRGKRAADAGQCSLLVRERSAHHGMNRQPRCGRNNVLHAVDVRNARQFHQDLVIAQPVLLNDRLAHTKTVDAIANI